MKSLEPCLEHGKYYISTGISKVAGIVIIGIIITQSSLKKLHFVRQVKADALVLLVRKSKDSLCYFCNFYLTLK